MSVLVMLIWLAGYAFLARVRIVRHRSQRDLDWDEKQRRFQIEQAAYEARLRR